MDIKVGQLYQYTLKSYGLYYSSKPTKETIKSNLRVFDGIERFDWKFWWQRKKFILAAVTTDSIHLYAHYGIPLVECLVTKEGDEHFIEKKWLNPKWIEQFDPSSYEKEAMNRVMKIYQETKKGKRNS